MIGVVRLCHCRVLCLPYWKNRRYLPYLISRCLTRQFRYLGCSMARLQQSRDVLHLVRRSSLDRWGMHLPYD